MQVVNKIILFQTDRENEVLKLDKLWHATCFHCISACYIWFLFFLKEQGKFWFPLFKISIFNRLQQLFSFLFFYLAFCSALQQLSVSTAWTPAKHKKRTGTNPPAVFFSLTNMFFCPPPLTTSSRCQPYVSGYLGQTHFGDGLCCFLVHLPGSVPATIHWMLTECSSRTKTVTARALIHTVKLN